MPCCCRLSARSQLWDLKTNKLLREWREHRAEVYAVDWNLVNKEQVLTGAWDNALKLWHPDELASIASFREHTKCIYAAQWHPRHADMFASASGDCTVKVSGETTGETRACVRTLCCCSPQNAHTYSSAPSRSPFQVWDTNTRRSSMTIHAHDFEVLTCDWNKYNEFLLCTGSVDKTIRTWDIRAPRQPVTILEGHEFAVRRIKCSPHSPSVIASVS